MKKTNFILMSLVSIIIFQSNIFAQSASDLVGLWQPSEGTSYVKIEREGDKFYGKVVWLKEPKDEQGNEKTDKKNPDKSLRSRPVKGMRMLKDFVFDEKAKEWKSGNIYDPKSGSTYYSNIKYKGKNQIEVRGSLDQSGYIGRTDTWVRVEKKTK
ncbi:MAG: DUF2147 domain-containing protein [Cytophagales bacterium]|nr:MAG: DUF2147 domain-containing protein [Cytophagales bacterium]TAH29566.1 MAG: DUF2147 domain-containing protein [Cytophagales bacterium]